MKPTIYIGIDPDVRASGVCVWNADTRTIDRLECVAFPALIEFFRTLSTSMPAGSVQITCDAGWLNRSNFHARRDQSHRVSANIGERTGANHETGKKIVEMAEYFGLSCELHRPTTAKVKAAQFKAITGWKGRTNQDMRDAAMLVYEK